MKIGEKIIATTDYYAPDVPVGAVMTVTSKCGKGAITATLDGGDDFDWFMRDGTYEPYTPNPKTTGTLKELNVKPGDVVKWLANEGSQHTVISAKVITEGDFIGEVDAELSGYGLGIFGKQQFTLISRADTPASIKNLSTITTPFGLLDKETQDAMQAAWDSGCDVECFDGYDWLYIETPNWNPKTLYRIKSKPIMITLTRDFSHLGKHVITCRQDGTEPTVEWVEDK